MENKQEAQAVNITRVGEFVTIGNSAMQLSMPFRYKGKFRKYLKFRADNLDRETMNNAVQALNKTSAKVIEKSGSTLNVYFENDSELAKSVHPL